MGLGPLLDAGVAAVNKLILALEKFPVYRGRQTQNRQWYHWVTRGGTRGWGNIEKPHGMIWGVKKSPWKKEFQVP